MAETPGATRVLLIEGEAQIAAGLAMILGATGFAVEVANSGETGLDLARMCDFDLVLLGPNPPALADGGDMAARLRLARIDRPMRLLAATRDPGGDPAALQINPLP